MLLAKRQHGPQPHCPLSTSTHLNSILAHHTQKFVSLRRLGKIPGQECPFTLTPKVFNDGVLVKDGVEGRDERGTGLSGVRDEVVFLDELDDGSGLEGSDRVSL